MTAIRFEHVTKDFEDGTRAVDDLTLEVGDGEFLVIVGPSGCGKTTSLRMVAGLEDVTEGNIWIGDDIINNLPSHKRNIAMVFQNYALYPHMTILDNLAFGLKMKGVDKSTRYAKSREVAEILGLLELLERRPRQLSGGQRQRLAMGRAIVREPQAFLMDEPLSNLDAKMRVQMRAEIIRIQQRLGVTTLYVTHDQVEAMTMGDRVAVMKDGVLQQVATPSAIYDEPANVFVAGFIGSPSMNLISATIQIDSGVPSVRVGNTSLDLGPSSSKKLLKQSGSACREVILGIRPEHAEDAAFVSESSDRSRLSAVVEFVELLGSDRIVHASTDFGTFVARCTSKSKAEVRDRIDLAIDINHFYFFDPITGHPIS